LGGHRIELPALGYAGRLPLRPIGGSGSDPEDAATNLGFILQRSGRLGERSWSSPAGCPIPLRPGLPHVLSSDAIARAEARPDRPSQEPRNPERLPLPASPPLRVRDAIRRQAGGLSGHRGPERPA